MRKLDKLLRDRRVLMLLSILIAFLAWFAVAVYVNSEVRSTVKLTVKIDNNNQALKSAGVETVEQNYTDTIQVSVQGDRTVVGILNDNDFVVTPEFGSITGPGEYEVGLLIEKKDTTKNFSVVNNNYTVKVKLDYMASKTLKIGTSVENVKIAEGYIRGEVYTTPEELTIRGPQSAIEKVERCQVTINENVTLSDSKQYARDFNRDEVKLLDKDGNTLEKNNITTEASTITVTVPVLQKATLPLKVQFLGAPDSLDESQLKYTLSHTEIQVAGPKDTINKTKEISIGYYDLRNFKKGEKVTLDVDLPTGFTSLENVTQVTLEFDSSYKSGKSVTVSKLSLLNKPENYKVELETEKLYSVKLAGDSSQLDKISSSDLVGEIDLSDVELSKGTISVTVVIKVPNSDKVWVTGTYKATIKVSDR